MLRKSKKSYQGELVKIDQTPHFACLSGDTRRYEQYLSDFKAKGLNVDYSLEKLMKLSQHFAYLEGNHRTDYIITKEFKPNQYQIMDGVHRAVILKFKNINNFPVAVIK